jgi:hypothetical protein
MPTQQNYDPRSGSAGNNYGSGRKSSGGFGSNSGMGSSGPGFGGGGFGSNGSMGSGANVGQGFGNIDQSHAGTFGTGGLLGMGFNTNTTDGGQTIIARNPNGSPIYQQSFNVESGSTGTPGGGQYGQIGGGYSGGLSGIPGYSGGIPQGNAGNSAQPNYQGGYGGPATGGTGGGGAPYGGGYPQQGGTGGGVYGYSGGSDPAMNQGYMQAVTAGNDPSGGSGTGGQYGMSTELMEFNNGRAGNTPESLAAERSARQTSQNESYVDGLPMAQNSNEQTAQTLGYTSYQAFLNANPGQVMPGVQGIPGQGAGQQQQQQQGGYQQGAPYQPTGAPYQPGYGQYGGGSQGYYDPNTQTDYTSGFGGGPNQYEQQVQKSRNASRPGNQGNQTPGMFDAYNQLHGISSQPQGGANGYATVESGRSGARGQIDKNGNDITPGMGGDIYPNAGVGVGQGKGSVGNRPAGAGPNSSNQPMPVSKSNGTSKSGGSDGKARQTVNPFETYGDSGGADFGSGMEGGRGANQQAQQQINNGMAPPPSMGGNAGGNDRKQRPEGTGYPESWGQPPQYGTMDLQQNPMDPNGAPVSNTMRNWILRNQQEQGGGNQRGQRAPEGNMTPGGGDVNTTDQYIDANGPDQFMERRKELTKDWEKNQWGQSIDPETGRPDHFGGYLGPPGRLIPNPNYGGSNSPMGTHGQTGEQIMAPGGNGGGGYGPTPEGQELVGGMTRPPWNQQQNPDDPYQGTGGFRPIGSGGGNFGVPFEGTYQGGNNRPDMTYGQGGGFIGGGMQEHLTNGGSVEEYQRQQPYETQYGQGGGGGGTTQGQPPWMGPNPTQPYPEGNMVPGGGQQGGGQSIEGNGDPGDGSSYRPGGVNYPGNQRGQRAPEGNMTPGGGGFNPFGQQQSQGGQTTWGGWGGGSSGIPGGGGPYQTPGWNPGGSGANPETGNPYPGYGPDGTNAEQGSPQQNPFENYIAPAQPQRGSRAQEGNMIGQPYGGQYGQQQQNQGEIMDGGWNRSDGGMVGPPQTDPNAMPAGATATAGGGWNLRIPWTSGGGFETRGYTPGKGLYMS